MRGGTAGLIGTLADRLLPLLPPCLQVFTKGKRGKGFV